MKKLFLLISWVAILLPAHNTMAQGCISIRNMVSGATSLGNTPKTWQFSANYRYFKSFRHFRGTEEEPDRLTNNTEVINNDNSLTLGATYTVNDKWALSASIPFMYITRSSLYEHDFVNRHESSSNGLGDMRIVGYYGALHGKTNIQLGLGFKLPTGNYNYQDDFNTGNGIVRHPVDQSIQPGDGGFGIITQANFMQHLSEHFSIYGNAMYMFNPRNTNGTRTWRETISPILQNEAIMSVADQYYFRVGGQYLIKGNVGITLGIRAEGIPVQDIIGESEGFRRPGYIGSIEPGIFFRTGPHTFVVDIPLAVARNRQQSLTDKETEQATGNPRHGDAAFADYLLSFTYAFRLNKLDKAF